MATLQEISTQARTSIATVSLVLSGKAGKRVSEGTRTKIKRVAENLGYFPNAAARMMKTGRFGQIACMVSEYRREQSNATFTLGQLRYVDVVTKLLADCGYSTIIEPVYLDWRTGKLVEISRVFSEVVVDGILGVDACGGISHEIDRRIQNMNTPVIWLNRVQSKSDVPCIKINEALGAKLLVDHLVELGHRRIAYIGPEPGGHYSVAARMEGVRDALIAQGLDASYVLSESWHPNTRELAQQLLKKQPRPTAFICNNRKRYDAVLHEASRLGLRVPYDISICCFAGVQDVNDYPMTAVVVPEAEMSKVGVDCLIDLIKTRKAPGMIPDIAPSFFRGETTLPPSSE